MVEKGQETTTQAPIEIIKVLKTEIPIVINLDHYPMAQMAIISHILYPRAQMAIIINSGVTLTT